MNSQILLAIEQYPVYNNKKDIFSLGFRRQWQAERNQYPPLTRGNPKAEMPIGLR